jgi:Tfp pilus assembly protein PilF
MTVDGRIERALSLFQQAYREQLAGRLDHAADLYRASIRTHPTAEAHTFLAWTYSFQDRYEEAIAECRKAIEVDPDFGNPYNDIGSYLIQLGRAEEAISWLEKAKQAPRYGPRHFPYLNLAKAYLALGRGADAQREMAQARFLHEQIGRDEADPPPAGGGSVH